MCFVVSVPYFFSRQTLVNLPSSLRSMCVSFAWGPRSFHTAQKNEVQQALYHRLPLHRGPPPSSAAALWTRGRHRSAVAGSWLCDGLLSPGHFPPRRTVPRQGSCSIASSVLELGSVPVDGAGAPHSVEWAVSPSCPPALILTSHGI